MDANARNAFNHGTGAAIQMVVFAADHRHSPRHGNRWRWRVRGETPSSGGLRSRIMVGPTGDIPQGLDLRIQCWAAWVEGEDSPVTGGAIHPGLPLPTSLRRRITPIGRKALETAWAVLAGWQGQEPRIILSSRHGEYARTVGLLGSLVESGEVSPAEFSLAVHHGLAGLLSIVTGNHAGHTAIAAGSDSFGAALTEAAACLADGDDSVLVMHFDEALPESYAAVGGEPEPGIALALLLGPAGGQGIALDWQATERAGGECSATALVRLLKGDSAPVQAVGERMVWSFRHVA